MDTPKRILLQVGLFLLTIMTTTLAGAEWMYGKFLFIEEAWMTWSDFLGGFNFSIPFLLILSVHEFAHYLTARSHGIRVSLPYYIPLWFGFLPLPSFGTMGAFIRIRQFIQSRKEYFDVGVSGPLAGFAIAMVVIFYGFTHLPEPDFIFHVHPEYEQYGADYADYVYDDEEGVSFQFGNNLIYWWFQNYVVDDPARMPNPNEIIHYPYLLAGYLALFFTALNLLPIGQLDGGHVVFGLFGQNTARQINRIVYSLFLFYAGIGWIHPDMLTDVSVEGTFSYLVIIVFYVYFLYLCTTSMIENIQDRLLYVAIMFALQFLVSSFTAFEGYPGWMLFAFLIGRFLGVYHPPAVDSRPLSTGRKVLGWIAIVVFILSFSPRPFIIG
ncbi:MAG: site-2 protease family protein [Cyclobacteriaceae bacterium]|nr:site-2 protease family protein [Cyclobacteriaceae bacterium]